jgi:hypothetical protein
MMDTNIPVIDSVLWEHKDALGQDYTGYKNHCYRIANFSKLFDLSPQEYQLVSLTAAFHDLGIWTDHTFDYIAPSIQLLKSYHAMSPEFHALSLSIEMIENHHKIFPLNKNVNRLVEVFRKSDWMDITFGVRSFGMDQAKIRDILKAFPNSGFHACLVKLTAKRFLCNPLNPFPMMKI